MQGLIAEKGKQLSDVNARILALEEVVQFTSHDLVRREATVVAEKEQLALLEETMIALKPEVVGFSERLLTLEQALKSLLGDTLLAACLTVFTGMLPHDSKCELLKIWKATLVDCEVVHTEDFTLCQFMETTGQQFSLLPRHVVLDEGMRTCLYLAALVRTPPPWPQQNCLALCTNESTQWARAVHTSVHRAHEHCE